MGVLENKTALVTGASSGIGQAIAIALARSGADVVVHFHSSKAGAQATLNEIRKYGRRAVSIQADLSSKTDVIALKEQVFRVFESIDILVNNTGAALMRTSFVESDDTLWEESFNVNVMSAVRCSRVFLPNMIQRSCGRIINISSVSARTGGAPNSTHYTTMKGALNTFTHSLAKEVAPFGITVNAVAPGVIRTPFQEKTPGFNTEEVRRLVPLGRVGEVGDVAPLVVFLASDEASFITGEVYAVSGGR